MRARLFANRAVPIAARRTLLYAFGLSRFVHGAGALHLNQKGHQRVWHSTYINLWAHLVPFVSGNRPHSFQVLFVSKAPPPHLFLALQRARLFAKLIAKGFTTVLHMLQLEWETVYDGSWLAQLVGDVKAVSQWVYIAGRLGQSASPLHELCKQVQACSDWWHTVVRQAIKAYADDIVKWKAASRVLSVADGGAYQCHLCGDTFAQRSFLTVHLARKHQLYAPARHFTPGRHCVACLRTFATVMLAQAHLRRNVKCLRRAVWLIEPLAIDAVQEIEKADKRVRKTIRCGGWQQQVTTDSVRQGEGPLRITAVDIELDAEAYAIQVVAKQFRPCLTVVNWIEEYLASSSRSGPRQIAACWWLTKPSLVNSLST